MSIVWSAAFGALFLRLGRRVAGVMALAAFSHFLLDLPMHPADMALWPNASTHVGFGLWRALPTGWWFVELGFILIAGGYYVARARVDRGFGGRAGLALAVVVLLHLANSPWLSQL
jgi:hypothetical protein